ncbi:MAG TPA: hypothetical protein ENK21_05590 [Trueperaceae bacterium]|nr:hypothetical protein [Trueperaceae bacterium]
MALKLFKLLVLVILFSLSLVLAQGLSYDKVFEGELTTTDETLESDEYSDSYTLRLKKGQEVTFVMTSNQIKTYLIVVSPDGKQYDVGDLSEDEVSLGSEARLTIPINKNGKYEITATSYNVGELGSYSIGVVIDKGIYSNFSVGALAEGDEKFENGEYYDTTEFNFEAGEKVNIAIISDADGFDTFLQVDTPDGQSLTNDDFPEGNSNTSRVEFIATQSGTYVIRISSYDADEVGEYILAVGHKKP